mmetsp:Transcript_9183/g.21597  ORF Transcript_9183/g.21597 Transcript_9183/m.21597 type:complete len:239 (+) Transcript_9183:1183-1899(+)
MVVDAVKIIVFIVPAEGAEQTSVVHPGHVDTIDTDPDMTQNAIGSAGDVIKIPPRFLVVILRPELWFGKIDLVYINGTTFETSASLRHGKARSEIIGVDVVTILDDDALRLRLHDVPVIFFEILGIEFLAFGIYGLRWAGRRGRRRRCRRRSVCRITIAWVRRSWTSRITVAVFLGTIATILPTADGIIGAVVHISPFNCLLSRHLGVLAWTVILTVTEAYPLLKAVQMLLFGLELLF